MEAAAAKKKNWMRSRKERIEKKEQEENSATKKQAQKIIKNWIVSRNIIFFKLTFRHWPHLIFTKFSESLMMLDTTLTLFSNDRIIDLLSAADTATDVLFKGTWFVRLVEVSRCKGNGICICPCCCSFWWRWWSFWKVFLVNNNRCVIYIFWVYIFSCIWRVYIKYVHR